jgi:hypothetical protein
MRPGLPADTVAEIRYLKRAGRKLKEISRLTGVSILTAWDYSEGKHRDKVATEPAQFKMPAWPLMPWEIRAKEIKEARG